MRKEKSLVFTKQKLLIDLFSITFTFSARIFLKEKIRARNENTFFFIVITD